MGTLLLGYVGLEYWGMYRSQKNLESQWQQQAATMSTPGQPQLSPDQMLTRILIPKIQMDAIVVEGASRRDLSAGPGHMNQTAEPGRDGQRRHHRPSWTRFSAISMNSPKATRYR